MPEQIKEYHGFLNSFALKCIAMVTMLIDHTGMMLFPQNMILRMIGRLAFPIYCFLLVEGAVHTSNWKKYLERLFLFALISEIPFNLAVAGAIRYPYAQNVFFTLFLGLAAILILKYQSKEEKRVIFTGIKGILVLALVLLAELISADYGAGGVIFILIFYVFRSQLLMKSTVFAAAVVFLYGGIENFAILSLAPILCYNGKRGPGVLKYFFYIFYPAHLLLLYLLKRYVL